MASKKPKKDSNASNLLEALKFISVAQHSEGDVNQTHCRIYDGTVTAFDGGLTVGHYIDESLQACPHTQTLIAALSKCEGSISITELDSGKLSVKSGKFRALVPCVPFSDLQALQPDKPIATLTDALKDALAACIPLADDKGAEPFLCGVMLQSQTCVSTNRFVMIEAWHGIDLPPDLLIPKASANAIAKSSKPLKAFGYSDNSVTFFFDDDSFIKTQLFNCNFPKYKVILDIASNPQPLPEGFYESLDKVAPFSADNRVYFRNGFICSHPVNSEGASYEVAGLVNDVAYNPDYLNLIKPHCDVIDFRPTERMAVFFGKNVRGAIAPISTNKNG